MSLGGQSRVAALLGKTRDQGPSIEDLNELGERLNIAFEGQDLVLKAAVNRVYMGMLGGTVIPQGGTQAVDPSTFATSFPESWAELAAAFPSSAAIAYQLRFEIPNGNNSVASQESAAQAAQLIHDTVQQLVNERIQGQDTGVRAASR